MGKGHRMTKVWEDFTWTRFVKIWQIYAQSFGAVDADADTRDQTGIVPKNTSIQNDCNTSAWCPATTYKAGTTRHDLCFFFASESIILLWLGHEQAKSS